MSWRHDFPQLTRRVNGKPITYLDSAATSLKPWPVIERVGHFLTYETANVHRGAHFLSNAATEEFEKSRHAIAKYLGGVDPTEVIWTRGTTESINLVASSWAEMKLRPADEILLTRLEHHANIVPWQQVAERTGAVLKIVELNQDGELDLSDFRKKLTSKTKLLAMTQASNVLGTCPPVKEMARLAREQGALVLVDGAQAVAHGPVLVQELGADFYAFSSHKMFGPSGVGVLWARRSLLEEMRPYQTGGSMIAKVKFEKTTFNEVPYKFEAGTPALEGVVGLGAAVEYIHKLDIPAVAAHEKRLVESFIEQLKQVPGARILVPRAHRVPVVSFVIDGVHSSDLAQLLDQENVAIRAGHLCAQPLLEHFAVPSFARVSLSIYNEEKDLQIFFGALNKALGVLR